MSETKNYRKKNVQPMRPYVPGEDLTKISVNKEDTPELGGMIAVNPANNEDRWYVAKKFFEENYELAESMEPKYKPAMDNYSRWYVSGTNLPGFYGSTVASWSRLESEDQAKVASELCNLAYAAGYKQAQEDMRKALGLNIN